MQTRQLDTIQEVRVLSYQDSSRQQQMIFGDPAQASLSTDQMTNTASGSAQDGSVELTEAKPLEVSRMQRLKPPIRFDPPTGTPGKAKSHRRSSQRTYTTVTQTPFGKLVCMITRHGTCCDPWEHHDCDVEVETTYTFVPFWWVVKFGVTAFQLDLPHFSTRGWQIKVRAWNVYFQSS